MESKKCTKCLETKTIDNFSKDPSGRGGYRSACKPCKRASEIESVNRRKNDFLEVKEKTCSKCKNTKSISEFFKDKASVDGHYQLCKPCKEAKTQEWRENNREHYNSMMRDYGKKHRRKLHLAKEYKMTEDEYNTMLDSQQGKCAICEKGRTEKRPLAVDHDHDTGKVRGLLCYSCNRRMEVVDSDLLPKLVLYKNK